MAKAERAMRKHQDLLEKHAKLAERVLENETLKKALSERVKEAEKKSFEAVKELGILKEKTNQLSKENTELRATRAEREKTLLAEIKKLKSKIGTADNKSAITEGGNVALNHQVSTFDDLPEGVDPLCLKLFGAFN